MKVQIWRTRNTVDWTCNDFMFYFIHCYNDHMVRNHPNINDASWQEQAKQVEISMKIRGNALLRAMIDWVFKHYEEHPEWDKVRIGLVCGTTPLAEETAQEAGGDDDDVDWRKC
jgi:hypothetical protein